MSISLTELRQRLFQLADRVVETGEPLIVMRRGVRLRLIRDDSAPRLEGRLARLKVQNLVVGEPLQPHESPAQWSERPQLQVAESLAGWSDVSKRPAKTKK
jgi:antitoxin (DNA-binding transcriptional repressor) of toxin-antitoxin stability system